MDMQYAADNLAESERVARVIREMREIEDRGFAALAGD